MSEHTPMWDIQQAAQAESDVPGCESNYRNGVGHNPLVSVKSDHNDRCRCLYAGTFWAPDEPPTFRWQGAA